MMFWKKKKRDRIAKKVRLLELYLAGSTVFLPGREYSETAIAGVQVFILGMADMLRQVEKLPWEDFLDIYKATLELHNLLPSKDIEDFVNSIGKIASRNDDVERVMRQGAQSISMWVGERDANAPIDLISAVKFSEQHASSFSEVAAGSGHIT